MYYNMKTNTSGFRSKIPSIGTVLDVYLGKLSSYHGWGNHDSNQCTVLHHLLTPELKARLREKFQNKLDIDEKWSKVTCCNCGGRGHRKNLAPNPKIRKHENLSKRHIYRKTRGTRSARAEVQCPRAQVVLVQLHVCPLVYHN